MYTYTNAVKKRKLVDDLNIIPNNVTQKESFEIEISSSAEEVNPAFTKYDIAQNHPYPSQNGQLNFPGKWLVGVSKCTISNVLSSWKMSKNVPSMAFVKIGVKFENSKTIEIGTKYFENRLYTKTEAVVILNNFLSEIWLSVCNLNINGLNIVGNVFNSIIFAIIIDKIDRNVSILSIGNKSEISKKSWELFSKLFNAFRKTSGPNDQKKLERIEIFISSELNNFLGGFYIPDEVSNFESDNDLTTFENGVATCHRIAIIPFPKTSKCINIKNIINKSNVSPTALNILCNILPRNREDRTVKTPASEYVSLQLLDQIPLSNYNLLTPAIQYFPTKITYKKLPENCKINHLYLALTNVVENELVNIYRGTVIYTLNFKPSE